MKLDVLVTALRTVSLCRTQTSVLFPEQRDSLVSAARGTPDAVLWQQSLRQLGRTLQNVGGSCNTLSKVVPPHPGATSHS